MKISASLIIPVYNEETTLKQDLEKAIKHLDNLHMDYEIIAVNDKSTDNSKKILNEIEGITIINHPENKGYGASLKTGIKASKYDWIIITDTDGTYPMHQIPNLVKEASKNVYSLIIGERNINGEGIPLKRRHAKKFLNGFASYLSGHKIPDLNSGLRIFKKDLALEYWGLFPERFSFTSTITMAAVIHGHNTKFIPIEYYKRAEKSSMKASEFLRFIRLVMKLAFFFKPMKVFVPLSIGIFTLALLTVVLWLTGVTNTFMDTTFTVLCATAIQTFFFGVLAEVIIFTRK